MALFGKDDIVVDVCSEMGDATALNDLIIGDDLAKEILTIGTQGSRNPKGLSGFSQGFLDFFQKRIFFSHGINLIKDKIVNGLTIDFFLVKKIDDPTWGAD